MDSKKLLIPRLISNLHKLPVVKTQEIHTVVPDGDTIDESEKNTIYPSLMRPSSIRASLTQPTLTSSDSIHPTLPHSSSTPYPTLLHESPIRPTLLHASPISQTLIRPIEMSYNVLFSLYTDMTNMNKMHNKNLDEIDEMNKKFRELLDKFKKQYASEEVYNSQIKIFEQSILRGQNRNTTLKLFDEPSNFNSTIPIKSFLDLNVITDITMIEKIGRSSSFIFRAKYLGKPCYIKSFFIGSTNLIYEQQIYHYINSRNVQIKDFYEDYFVKIYDTSKTESRDFYNFLDVHNVKIKLFSTTNPLSDKFVKLVDAYDKFTEKILTNTYIYYIITEDTGGITYKEFFTNNYDNENLIINTIFDMIYGIYLMNNKLKIMHNDNHFENILIKTDLPLYESKYQIEKIEFTKTKNYRLCFYDFDMAFLENQPNSYLREVREGWLIQNKQSAKDIWTVINSIIRYIYYEIKIPIKNREYILNKIFNNNVLNKVYWSQIVDLTEYKKLNYIQYITHKILNNSIDHINKLEKNFLEHVNHRKFWNAYCVDNDQVICVIPDEPFLYPLPVLHRLIEDEYILKILNFITVDPFYKKYLKYKSKYLESKNNKNKF